MIVFINVYGCNVDGWYIDQNGNDVIDQIVLLDEVVVVGWKIDGVIIIGVGLCGYEVGMGNMCCMVFQVMLFDGIVVDFCLVVLVDYYVSVFNLNWGVYGFVVFVLKVVGCMDLFSMYQQYMDVFQVSVNVGVVDGVIGCVDLIVGGYDSNIYQIVVQMINLVVGKKFDVFLFVVVNVMGLKGLDGLLLDMFVVGM